MSAKSYKLRWQGRVTPRQSISFSYFSDTWKQSPERTVPMGRIPSKRIIWGCHISAPFLATLFAIHSRPPPLPPQQSFSLVICPLWSVLSCSLWMGCCSPAQSPGSAQRLQHFSGASLPSYSTEGKSLIFDYRPLAKQYFKWPKSYMWLFSARFLYVLV